MEKGMILFLGGITLVIALFIPLSVLQVDGSVPGAKKEKGGKNCTPFQTPHAVVGSYHCVQKRKKEHSELQVCRLLCPPSMQVRPKKNRILHRCHKGRWTVLNQEVHCVAKKPVSLVAQHSASPELLNTLLSSYLNHSYSYLAMAYFFDRADIQLPGYHKYFLHLWQTTLDMARNIMTYINKRGGWTDMQDLPRSRVTEILHMGHEAGHVGLVAMETALGMEAESQKQILQVMERVERRSKHDPHLLHTLEHKHLNFKTKIIKELMDYVTQLRAFEQTGDGDYEIGEYETDNVLQ